MQVLKPDHIRREQLASEINSLLKVHHPNIVQFLGACTREEPVMIVSELMEGTLQLRNDDVSLDFEILFARPSSWLLRRIEKQTPTYLLMCAPLKAFLCLMPAGPCLYVSCVLLFQS